MRLLTCSLMVLLADFGTPCWLATLSSSIRGAPRQRNVVCMMAWRWTGHTLVDLALETGAFLAGALCGVLHAARGC